MSTFDDLGYGHPLRSLADLARDILGTIVGPWCKTVGEALAEFGGEE